ncbi:hypothetical protein L195_g015399 [Trifolium pratense]|uniref:DUF676 domain-containing protein n=1 Tax=Trifolium pratense TaxID=57577 RepID=A0A2K3MNC1_TRIPR|nr:hypothetical protein L195_g015399 [Trifolium pratense]
MLASDSTVVLRIPVRNPTRSQFNTFSFDSGGTTTRSRPSFFLCPSLSFNSIKMQLLRPTGCYSNRCLKVHAQIGGQDFFNAAVRDKRVPRHLVIMVNGITGRYFEIDYVCGAMVTVKCAWFFSASDWRYAAEQLVKRLPDKVIVHRSECNSSRLTFDGVDTMGERLAEEVLSVVRRWPEVQKISFVAHSLGGLVARYAIGRLYDNSSKLERVGTSRNCFSEETTEYSKQCLKQIYEAKIAGLEPMNFITFATPHLGSRGNNQVLFYEPQLKILVEAVT